MNDIFESVFFCPILLPCFLIFIDVTSWNTNVAFYLQLLIGYMEANFECRFLQKSRLSGQTNLGLAIPHPASSFIYPSNII